MSLPSFLTKTKKDSRLHNGFQHQEKYAVTELQHVAQKHELSQLVLTEVRQGNSSKIHLSMTGVRT